MLVVCATLVVLVGPSRIYLGDHWATDVAGAYLFEGALLCLAFLLYFKLKQMSPRFKAIGIGVVKRLRSELLESRAKRW